MMLDLGDQYGFQRRFARNAPLKRPLTLQDLVVAVGEKRLGRSIEQGLQEMQRAEAIISGRRHADPQN
jgi:hypothetical protein